jgi:hypothetical protein
VLCAFFHDLGMGLSSEERQARLAPESDLWDKLDLLDGQRRALHYLGKKLREGNPGDSELAVAAALRLADLIDFDRERTPQVLFRYLIPSSEQAATPPLSIQAR